MPRVIRTLIAAAFSFAIFIPGVSAQQAQDPTNPPPPQTLTKEQRKEQKQKARKTLKELDSQYKQWLNEDVIYIISPEERNAFLQLSSSGYGAAAIPTFRTTILKKSTTAASLTPTSTSPPGFLGGRRTVVACTSCGVQRMR
jgi:hypothetical protein